MLSEIGYVQIITCTYCCALTCAISAVVVIATVAISHFGIDGVDTIKLYL